MSVHAYAEQYLLSEMHAEFEARLISSTVVPYRLRYLHPPSPPPSIPEVLVRRLIASHQVAVEAREAAHKPHEEEAEAHEGQCWPAVRHRLTPGIRVALKGEGVWGGT